MATSAPSTSAGDDTVENARPLPRMGYRVEIFERKTDREKYSCGFCAHILRNPVQADCGHRFCDDCRIAIGERAQAGQSVLCKKCAEDGLAGEQCELNPDLMNPDRGILREMSSIIVKCPNELCIYSRPFKEYIRHETECRFRPVTCDMCGVPFSKQKLKHHKSQECLRRPIKCELCNEKLPFIERMMHLMKCPKVPQPCDQCRKLLAREKMSEHQSRECPNRSVTCPLEECSSSPLSDFIQHVLREPQASKHLAWVVSRVSDLDTALSQLTEENAAAIHPPPEAPPPSMAETVDRLTQRLEHMERQLQEYLRAAEREGSSRGGGGGGLAGGGVTGGASVVSGGGGGGGGGSHSERSVSSTEAKVNSLEPILCVLHREMAQCIVSMEGAEETISQEAAWRQESEAKVARSETAMAHLSKAIDELELRMGQLEGTVVDMSRDVPDGTLLWRISNFSKVRQEAMKGTTTSITSRPFCTGPIGYKMRVVLYPNGDGVGRGTHLSISLSLMRGPHDALLPWPFAHKVFITLIDQNWKKHVVCEVQPTPHDASFQRPVSSECNPGASSPSGLLLSRLHQPGHAYLKDDTLFIRVTVCTDGLRDHLRQFDPWM
ncbi:TNF receptor-associated factor 2-like isoform X2 [Babylonia areolata]|uniref:TNF receptor-associated factor 2-like isoform X2 n=1 Tax=Babylonia areolata TaxID=304850 RepID=UPI003FD6A064